jgi:hypothetical protein
VTGRDGLGQHAQNRPVVGCYPSGYRSGDPNAPVNIGVVNSPAADVTDDLGCVRDRECLGTGECVLGAGMGLRVGQRRSRDCGDVFRVDEGLRAITTVEEHRHLVSEVGPHDRPQSEPRCGQADRARAACSQRVSRSCR